jgi:polar amino acid transport system substrate-binding protein
MTFSRLIIVLAACQIAIFSNALVAQPIEVELLVDKNFEPYSYLENGNVTGIYADLVEAAFSLMPDFNVKLTAVNWNEGKKRIENGETLGLVGVYFHGHDWPYMYPYSIAFGQETVITICHEKVLGQKREQWPQDYKGLLVGNIEGYDGWLDNQVRSENNTKYVNFLEVPNINIALQMVGTGNLDCALFESTAFDFAKSQQVEAGKLREQFTTPIMASQISSNPVHLGYSRKAIIENKFPYAFEFQQAFDIAIFQLERSGKADLIRKKYQP